MAVIGAAFQVGMYFLILFFISKFLFDLQIINLNVCISGWSIGLYNTPIDVIFISKIRNLTKLMFYHSFMVLYQAKNN